MCDSLLDGLSELVKVFFAHGFCEFVIDFRFFDFSDFFDCRYKQGFFAGQIFGMVVFRESRFYFYDFAGFLADKLVFITRNKGVGTDFQRISFAFAARKFYAVNGTDKIDNRNIAFGRNAVFFNLNRVAAALSHIVQRFFNFLVGNFRYRLFDFNCGEVL